MGAAGATAKEGARRMRLYLTRHGQTEWNVSQKMQGACDSPLTELGVRQAEQLQKRLELLPVDKAYVSPLKRAMDTARLLVGGRGLEMTADKRLSEASLGAFEGLTIEQAQARYPEQALNFRRHPERFRPVGDGEDFHQVQARVEDFLSDLARRERGNVLVVAHALVLRIARLALMGLPLDQLMDISVPSCCFCEAEYEDGAWHLIAFGECWHHARDFDRGVWYYGAPGHAEAIRPGALITPFPNLARALGACPSALSLSLDGHIDHNGLKLSRLYRVQGVEMGELEPCESPEIPLGRVWRAPKAYRLEAYNKSLGSLPTGNWI